MSFKRVLLCAGTLILILASSSDSFAQVRGQRGPIRKSRMFIGWGWGNGNHWRNPGPNSGYYNPWTSHNSTYFSRGDRDMGFGPANENIFYVQPGTPTLNNLPGEVINVEVESQPNVTPNDTEQAPADPDEIPDIERSEPESDESVSGWKLDNTQFDEDNLFQRPVMSKPKYKPTVIDDTVNKKIKDLQENNFWNEK